MPTICAAEFVPNLHKENTRKHNSEHKICQLIMINKYRKNLPLKLFGR